MKLRTTLLHIAALASAAASATVACSGGAGVVSGVEDGAGDKGDAGKPGDAGNGGDAAADGSVVGCGGCNCTQPKVTQATATADQACAIAARPPGTPIPCDELCAAVNPGGATAGYYCSLPPDYQTAYKNAQTDTKTDPDAGPTCPAWAGTVTVGCGFMCLGRRTAGIDDPTPCDDAALGQVFAERAYLEAVSVHAFARLERELAFHEAPASLRRDARRARRDEVRHTAMTLRLARRFGTEGATLPEAPEESAARSLFEIARENAVEGCVRETYGAVMGLLEASVSADADVRDASAKIAGDECRHAELAMDVARWITPRLDASERAAITRAVEEAIAELRDRGDRHVVEMLASQVWSAMLAA